MRPNRSMQPTLTETRHGHAHDASDHGPRVDADPDDGGLPAHHHLLCRFVHVHRKGHDLIRLLLTVCGHATHKHVGVSNRLHLQHLYASIDHSMRNFVLAHSIVKENINRFVHILTLFGNLGANDAGGAHSTECNKPRQHRGAWAAVDTQAMIAYYKGNVRS